MTFHRWLFTTLTVAGALCTGAVKAEDLLPLFPESTIAALEVDLTRLRQSGFYQKQFAEKGLADFIASLAIDETKAEQMRKVYSDPGMHRIGDGASRLTLALGEKGMSTLLVEGDFDARQAAEDLARFAGSLKIDLEGARRAGDCVVVATRANDITFVVFDNDLILATTDQDVNGLLQRRADSAQAVGEAFLKLWRERDRRPMVVATVVLPIPGQETMVIKVDATASDDSADYRAVLDFSAWQDKNEAADREAVFRLQKAELLEQLTDQPIAAAIERVAIEHEGARLLIRGSLRSDEVQSYGRRFAESRRAAAKEVAAAEEQSRLERERAEKDRAERERAAKEQQAKDLAELKGLFTGETEADEVYFVALIIQQVYLKWPNGPEFFDPVVEAAKDYSPIGLDGEPIPLKIDSNTMYAEWYVATKLDVLALRAHIYGRPQLAELKEAIDVCLKRLDAVEQYLTSLDLISGDKLKETWGGVAAAYAGLATQAFGEAFVGRLMSTSPSSSKEEFVAKLILELGFATVEAVGTALSADEKHQERVRAARMTMARSDEPLENQARRIWIELRSQRDWPYELKTRSASLGDRVKLYEGEQHNNPLLGLLYLETLPALCKEDYDVISGMQQMKRYLRQIPSDPAYNRFRDPFIVTYFELEGLWIDRMLSHSVEGGGAFPSFTQRSSSDGENVIAAAATAISVLDKRSDKKYALKVRSQLAYAYAAAGQTESALKEFMGISKERTNDYFEDWDWLREFREAKLAAASGLYEPALDLLQNQVRSHRDDILHNPDFDGLKQKHPERFRQLTEIRLGWSFQLGLFGDDITVKNQSKFALSDLSITVDLYLADNSQRDKPDHTLVLESDYLYAGASQTWKLRGNEKIPNRSVARGRIRLRSKQGTAEQEGAKQ